jgi:hypothetical protein
MSVARVRPPRLLLALLALLSSLALPSLHVDALHHGDASDSAAAALVASHPASPVHGAPAAADADTCSLCRVAGQARSLLTASDRQAAADLDGPTRGLHLPLTARIPAERTLAVAAPRAPPTLLLPS